MPSRRPWWWDIELILPLCLFIVTTIYLAATFQISTAFDSGFVNSAFGPRVAAVVMYVALLFVLRDAWRGRRQGAAAAGEAEPAQSDWTDPAKIVGLTALYITAFQPLGYVISTLLYVYVLFYLLRFDERSQLKRIAYTAGITAIFYVLFDMVFNVRLPTAGGLL